MKQALLIYGGWDGHKPQETGSFVADLIRPEGFAVELSNSLDSLNDPAKLQALDLLIIHWTMGTPTGDQSKNLAEAVKSGVGLAGFHGGLGDAFRNDTGFQFIVGGQFVAHPDNHKDHTVQIAAPHDPIVAGLGEFQVHTEQYYMHVDPSNEVLATTTFQTTSAPWVNGTVMPVAWKRHYGQGRVFYHSLGHELATLQVPEVRTITQRGFLWAAR